MADVSDRSPRLSAWHDLFLKIGVPIAAAAVAWGATTTQVSANTQSIDKLWSSNRELKAGPVSDLQKRIAASEAVNASILAHLDEMHTLEARMDAKLDRLEERR